MFWTKTLSDPKTFGIKTCREIGPLWGHYGGFNKNSMALWREVVKPRAIYGLVCNT
jgi:hypothetical protein